MKLPQSFARFWAILTKEFIQMRRDRMTFAMMIGIPVMQLILFGFAINTDPRHLPTALMDWDQSNASRAIVAALDNSTYLDIKYFPNSQNDAERLMLENKVNFIIEIPPGFSAKLGKGARPQLLVIANATDPSAASGALANMQNLMQSALRRELQGGLAAVAAKPSPVDVVLQRRYNPAGITAYNIVPGLLGVILAMTMMLMTAVALTRETERGTMENLLAMPSRPGEVMAGKIVPYVFVGLIQTCVFLIAAKFLFHVPFQGSLAILFMVTLFYIIVNLTIGFVLSTLAKSQMQAMQMTFFLLLPQILLSGFMFPFRGMPNWAQAIGEILPATHFMRLMRDILLKGSPLNAMWADIWPLLALMGGLVIVALGRYRRTLD